MNNGIEAFRSQLQKELGLSIGPKDPLLALWVSQKELLEQNAASGMALESAQRLASVEVPEPQGPVFRGRQGSGSIGRYRQSADRLR